MVTRRVATLLGILLCMLPLCPTAFGESPRVPPNPSAQDMDFTTEGKITEISAGKLTMSSGENMIFHVVYNDTTEVKKKDGSAGTTQDLRVGLRISVAGTLAESGELTAKKIEIENEGSEKP